MASFLKTAVPLIGTAAAFFAIWTIQTKANRHIAEANKEIDAANKAAANEWQKRIDAERKLARLKDAPIERRAAKQVQQPKPIAAEPGLPPARGELPAQNPAPPPATAPLSPPNHPAAAGQPASHDPDLDGAEAVLKAERAKQGNAVAERRAMNLLKSAKAQLKSNPLAAERKLRQIIEQFPATDAAKKAADLLEERGQPRKP